MNRSLLALLLSLMTVFPAAAQDMPLSQVLIPGQGWKALPGRFSAVTGSADGSIFVADLETKTVHRLHGEDAAKPVGKTTDVITSLAVARDGTMYAAQPEKQRVIRFKADGSEEKVANGYEFRFVAVSPTGIVYCTANDSADVFLVDSSGKTEVAATGLKDPMGLFVTPDGGTVVVGVRNENHLWAFGIDPKTQKLTHRDRYYYPLRQVLQDNSDKRFSSPTGYSQDKAGRLYASTAAGIQVFDPTGRPCGVLLAPAVSPASGMALGGPDGDALFVLHGETLYTRKTKAHVINSK